MSEPVSDYFFGDGRFESEPADFETFSRQFENRFPRESDCIEELFQRLNAESNFVCRMCGSQSIEREYGARDYRCLSCGKYSWFTSGTFFHRMKIARPYLAFIMLKEYGIAVSTSRFRKALAVSYSTAADIFQRLSMVISRNMDKSFCLLPSASFSDLFCKRSRETPARKHPVSEEHEFQYFSSSDEHDGVHSPLCEKSLEIVLGFELDAQSSKIVDLLKAQATSFEELISRSGMTIGALSELLLSLELAGIVSRQAGDNYVFLQPNNEKASSQESLTSEEESSKVRSFVSFLRGVFQGISRKYLQNYLASYWCHVDRKIWAPGSLFKACARFGVLQSKEVLEYVSPLEVKMAVPGSD